MYITCTVCVGLVYMLISSECYHLYVSIDVLCVHVVCMYIHIVDKYTVAVSVMCKFAVYVHVHCMGFVQCYYFYNHKEPVSLLIVYYYFITIIFKLCCLLFPEKQKTDFSASKLRPSRMRSLKAHLEAGPVIYSY